MQAVLILDQEPEGHSTRSQHATQLAPSGSPCKQKLCPTCVVIQVCHSQGGKARVRAGHGRAGQGRAGRAGQGRAGREGRGRAGRGGAGLGREGQGRAGPGRAGQGRAGQGMSRQGLARQVWQHSVTCKASCVREQM